MSDQEPVTEWNARANAGDTEALDAVAAYILEYVRKECLWAVQKCGLSRSERSDVAGSVCRIVSTAYKQGRFASVADRKALHAMLKKIIHDKAVDVKRKEDAEERRRKEIVQRGAVLEWREDEEALSHATAPTQNWLERLMNGFEPCERAITQLILDGCHWGDIPKQLLPEYGKITRYKVGRVRAKLKRRLKSER